MPSLLRTLKVHTPEPLCIPVDLTGQVRERWLALKAPRVRLLGLYMLLGTGALRAETLQGSTDEASNNGIFHDYLRP